MKTYTFDVTMSASISIEANSKAEAEATIRDCLGGTSVNAGAWPNGDPIVFEPCIEGEIDFDSVYDHENTQ